MQFDLPSYPQVKLPDLSNIAKLQDEIEWHPLFDGVEIHRLYGDGKSGPSAALIRFGEQASIPLHKHNGYEHLYILWGSQRDQNGVLETGTFTINPPGTRHRVVSESGCIVLAIYEKPVSFL